MTRKIIRAAVHFFPRLPIVQRTLSALAVLIALGYASAPAHAQNMSGMPDYGAYVHTGKLDVYNAMNGQIALNIPISSHAYRGFNYQFGLRYSSNIWNLHPAHEPCSFTPTTHEDCMFYPWFPDNEGWKPFSNYGGVLGYSDVVFQCTSIFWPGQYSNVRAKYAIRSNYTFQDYASGRIYLFPVRRYLNTTPNLTCPEIGDGQANALVAPSDEGGMQLDITNDVPGGNSGGPSTYKITTQDGTVISGWSANGGQVQRITDTNGNTLTFDGSVVLPGPDGKAFVLPSEDTLCTPLPQIGVSGTQDYTQFFCYIDSNGATQNVRVDYTYITFTPAFPTTTSPDWGYQSFIQYPNYGLNVISKITLPNNLAYTFSYDPAYGVLSKITLPTGGYIRYTWAPIAQRKAIPNTSLMTFVDQAQDVLVLTSRSESADGAHEQTWNYSYAGTWQTGWTTTITDPLQNKEVHSFPGVNQFPSNPMETRVQYLDASNNLLKQVDKIWGGEGGPVQLGFALASPQDNVGSVTAFVWGPLPSESAIDILGDAYSDAQDRCNDLGSGTCIVDATQILQYIDNLPAYLSSGISLAGSIPAGNGSTVYGGIRNTKLLSQTTTEYIGGQTLVSTSQTDYNDCSTYLNFTGNSSPGHIVASYSDCRDNPTQIREYGYDKAANTSASNFGNGHSATTATSASRYSDLTYLQQGDSTFGAANYSQYSGSSIPPTGPLAYDTSGSHILDRVVEKKIYDGVNNSASSPASDAKASYDSHGNALTKSAWLNTTNSWLARSFTYDSYGNMLTSTDANGNVTSYDYTDNYTDSSKNTGTARFATKITLPATGSVQHVARKAYDWNTGLVKATCGENFSSTDFTSASVCQAGLPITQNDYTTYSYDAMNRPLTVADGSGGLVTFQYNESSVPVSMMATTAIDSSRSLVRTAVLDGLGRVKQTQLNSDPQGVDYVDTTYDLLGRVASVSNPYRSISDPTYGTIQTQYDAMGRITQVTKQDGSVGTISYAGNCVTSSDEAGNPRRSCSDALGRLIEVDEPNAASVGTNATASVTISGGLSTTPVTGASPPLPVSGSPLASFVASDGSSTQVLFLGSNQFIYDVLWNTTGGWQDIEVSAVGGDVPAASSSLLSAVTQSSGPEHIFFEGTNQHIYDLNYHGGSGWRTQDLNAATGAASAMAGSSLASSAPGSGSLGGNVYTFYLGGNQHIYTQYWNSGNSSWQSADMTALTGATPAAGSKLSVSYRADSTLDVFYEASNQHIYDMSWTTTNGWQNQDLTAITGNTLAATGAAMTSDGGVNGNPVHLYYSGTNQHIYCLYWNSQTAAWANADLTATTGGAVAASGSSLSEANLLDGTTHIFYESANQHIYQLFCCTSSWQSQDLTAGTGNILAATGTALTSFAPASGPVSGNGYVVYLGTNQHVYTIYWNQSSWQNADLTSISANIAIDSGTVAVNVGGFVATACYGPTTNSSCSGQAENINSSDVASALAQALNVPGSPATASASGSTINMTWKIPGPLTPSVSALSTTHDQPSLFSNPSFTSPATSFSGGAGPAIGTNDYVTLYSYDALGNFLSVTQKGGTTDQTQWRARNFTYDSLSRLLTAYNPESGTITYSYDANGNLLQKTSPAPNQTGSATQTISYCYDVLNRITGKAYSAQICQNGQLPQGTAVVSYAYDAGTNGIGHMTSLTDQAGSGSYGYDAMGRIASESRTIAGASKTLNYTYNLDGSLKTLAYPSGAVIAYTPDSAGRMVSAVDSGNNINYVTGAGYGPDSGLTGFISGNSNSFAGITNSFTYNKRLQPVYMSAATPTQTVFSIGYDFHLSAGDNGNVFGITNYKDTSRNQRFTYDALNRLASAQNAGIDCSVTLPDGHKKFWGNSYGYDSWGNLLQKNVTKCSAENLQINIDTNNHIQTTGYNYDAAGNMLNDGLGHNFTYDPENRITGAAGYSYTYDADGNRVKKSNGTTGTLYWYMSPGIVAETDLSGNLTSEYVFFASERVARRDNPASSGPVFYYFSDHLKTTDIVTDAQGNIKNESDFYPWGGELQFLANDSNHYKFTGKERDAETGLDYFGARYYGNALGRFITPDWSAIPVPIPYADLIDPQSLNQYSYVRNIPTTNVDADGHWPQLLTPSVIEGIEQLVEQGAKEGAKMIWRRAVVTSAARVTIGSVVIIGAYASSPFIQTVGQSDADERAQIQQASQERAVQNGGVDPQERPQPEPQVATGGAGFRKGSSRWDQLMNKLDRIKNQAAGGGNKGVSGTVSAAEADFLGKRWVGDGYATTTTKDGTTIYLSKDGTRQYRGPSQKSSDYAKTGVQANFQQRQGDSGAWTSNVHVNIQ